MRNLRYLAFDADDTLWENENHFQDAEKQFQQLLSGYGTAEQVSGELFQVEMKNLPAYGYGTKGFVLSMIETAIRVSGGTVPAGTIGGILSLGQDILKKPVILLPHVREVLEHLSGCYRLILATKGDLLEQERKLRKSGLSEYFSHIEIMSEKNADGYRRILDHLEISPSEFLMVGNSLKSDILPVIQLGAAAVHIPYHLIWQHEIHENPPAHEHLFKLDSIRELPELLHENKD